jgi:hypothetical protein
MAWTRAAIPYLLQIIALYDDDNDDDEDDDDDDDNDDNDDNNNNNNNNNNLLPLSVRRVISPPTIPLTSVPALANFVITCHFTHFKLNRHLYSRIPI